MRKARWLACISCMLLVACGDDEGGAGGGGSVPNVPESYSFERGGESTVAYLGQTTRQVLVSDLIGLMEQISDSVLAGEELDRYDTRQEVFALLTPLYEEGGLADPSRSLPDLLDGEDALLQATYADLNDANLRDKLAGNDSVTDHASWNDGAFVGWADENLIGDDDEPVAPSTPETLLLAFLRTFASQAAAGAVGDFPIDAATPLYLTPAGHDLTQLVEKVLLGAVNFSQGTDDYLDDDVEDKGLLKANVVEDDDPYTGLEHHWDEAFGYWGAARDYAAYTDEEIAGAGGREEYADGYFDSDGDGSIDLRSEYNFSASVNAAKRDRGSDPDAGTNFTRDADVAWRTGRAIIANAFETGEDVDMEALGEQRDIIVTTWEKALAATAIHYINDVLGDMDAIGSEEYSFADHAKHWSELKGFALSFQFNPRSPMSEDDFAAIHEAIGDEPVGASAVSPSDDMSYRTRLVEARGVIGDTYGFDEANINGW